MPIIGALDFTQFRAEEHGVTKRYRYGMYTGPAVYSNYYTNGGTGDPVIPGDLKLGQIHIIFFDTAINSAGAPLCPMYIGPQQGGPAAGTIIWLSWTSNAEVANATNLSGYAAYFEAIGL
jgi:hypothetical protein